MIDVMAMRTATVEQLDVCRDLLRDEIKRRRKNEIQEAAKTIQVGKKYLTKGLSPARHNGKIVEVRAVKKTRASVIFEDEQTACTIPLICMEEMG